MKDRPRLDDLADPAADRLVQKLGRNVWAVNAMLRDVETEQSPLPEALPSEVVRFLEESAVLPAWACRQQMERAASFAEAHLPFLSVSLLCASLPMLFSSAKGAQLLTKTGRMIDDVDRRVNETGRFVLDVVEPGGFAPGGRAVRSLQKVRLIHAAVRQAAPGRINQQEMLGTLLAFSVLALRSMTRLGVRVDPRDAEAYWHLWRVAGALLGVEQTAIPERYEDAKAMIRPLIERQVESSEAGRALTAVLVDGLDRHLMIDGLGARLVTYLVGERIASGLGVPTTSTALAGASKIIELAPRVVPLLAPMIGRRGHVAVVSRKLRGERPRFPMPAVS